MPDLSVLDFVLFAMTGIAGAIVGWLLRNRHAISEKRAADAGWQHQIDAQQLESERLVEQNSNLMQQINEYQTSNKDTRQRAKQLSDSFRTAAEQRDSFKRKFKRIRAKLEVATAERDRLKSSADSNLSAQQAIASAVQEKSDKIERLKIELARWQTRVPPLVERYRVKNLEAQELSIELEKAQARIAALEEPGESDETRIDPISEVDLPAGLDASNDQYDEPAPHDLAEFEDQVTGQGDYPAVFRTGLTLDEPASDNHDNLQRIKGIGPAIEKTLHELGIHRFAQIVALSEYDLNRVADRIRGVRNRMRREDWIGQAQLLLSEKGLHPA